MAEMLGSVASGFSIAQVAGSVVKTGLKIRNLLKDIKSVPGELQQVQVQLKCIDRIGQQLENIGDNPAELNGALQLAIHQCEEAASSLRTLVDELSSEIERKRTRGRVWAVLHKEDLARHEKRLSETLNILMLAHQMYSAARQEYLIALQEELPSVIVTQLLEQLAANPNPVFFSQILTFTCQPAPGALPANAEDKSVTETYAPDTTHDGLQRGTTRMGSQSSPVSDERRSSHPLRLSQLSLPSWLSLKALRWILDRSQWGWLYPFHNFARYSIDSATYDLVWETIQSGCLEDFRMLTEGGTVSIYDRFYIPPAYDSSDWLRENSMTTMAMRSSSWEIFNYLTTHNVEFHGIAKVEPWNDTSESFDTIEKALQDHADNLPFLGVCLAGYDGAGSIPWRVHIAMSIVGCSIMSQSDSTAYIVRYLLSQEKNQDADGGTTTTINSNNNIILRKHGFGLPAESGVPGNTVSLLIFHLAVSLMKSVLVDSGHRALGWCELLQDVLASLLLESSSADDRGKKSLNQLHQQIFEALPLPKIVSQLNYYVPWQLSPIEWEVAVQVLLQVLSTCSVNLTGYGAYLKSSRLETLAEEAKQRSRKQPSRRPLGWIDGFHNVQVDAMVYGPCIEDWKVWVSEPTEVFVGDFWQGVESPEKLYVPGAWVEDIG
ncbi:hypothetical protein PG985_009968 [Apiospora marii]|uniref:uncharacterized protein n=1 Tax=Apiospora marii TaxID=335849 RepID=UPI00312D1746